MPYDIDAKPKMTTPHPRSAAFIFNPTDTGHGHASAASDPSDLFVPHVDPEDEDGLIVDHEHPASEAEDTPESFDPKALSAFIGQQAQEAGLDLIDHHDDRPVITFPIESVKSLHALLGGLDTQEPAAMKEKLIALRDRLGTRLQAIEEPGPSNLDLSVKLFSHLRHVFDTQVQGERLVTQDLTSPWVVPGGVDPTPRTAGRDLEKFYELRLGLPPIPGDEEGGQHGHHHGRRRWRRRSDDRIIVRHSVHALFQELTTLRDRQGGRLVKLHSDWRMWLAWLHTGNPILALAWMNQHLAQPSGGRVRECYDPDEIEHDRALRVFLVVGYQIDADRDELQRIIRQVANGARRHRDLPIRYLLRNSWNSAWGESGHAWIDHRDLAQQFDHGTGLLLPGLELTGRLAPTPTRAPRR
jgi:hypothetical protein